MSDINFEEIRKEYNDKGLFLYYIGNDSILYLIFKEYVYKEL